MYSKLITKLRTWYWYWHNRQGLYCCYRVKYRSLEIGLGRSFHGNTHRFLGTAIIERQDKAFLSEFMLSSKYSQMNVSDWRLHVVVF